MKKLIWLALPATAFCLTWGAPALAESKSRVQLDATIGTRFGGRHAVELEDADGAEVGSGAITTDSAFAWGLLLAYRVQKNGSVFFNYSRQETAFHFRTEDYSDDQWTIQEASGDASIEYFQLGGNLEASTRLAIPYLGVSVGLTRIASLEENDDWVRFNVTLDGGVRFELLPLLDLRILGRIPFTFPATELYCFTGHGCALIANGSPFVQVELQAGVGVRF